MSLRPQEINRAKLPLLFKREFDLCNVSAKETIVLLTDLKVRPVFIEAVPRPKRSVRQLRRPTARPGFAAPAPLGSASRARKTHNEEGMRHRSPIAPAFAPNRDHSNGIGDVGQPCSAAQAARAGERVASVAERGARRRLAGVGNAATEVNAGRPATFCESIFSSSTTRRRSAAPNEAPTTKKTLSQGDGDMIPALNIELK